MLENLKNLQNQVKTEVVTLGDFKGDLEKDVSQIYKEKEKRDRIGFIMSQVVANVSCNFENLALDESPNKQLASQIYLYKRYLAIQNETMQQREASSGENDDNQMYNGNNTFEDEKKLEQEFSMKVKSLLHRVQHRMLTVENFEKV